MRDHGTLSTGTERLPWQVDGRCRVCGAPENAVHEENCWLSLSLLWLRKRLAASPAPLHPAALLNGVMDRYADLLAFVQVTAKVEHPELERHIQAFFEASEQVQAVLRPEQYGPGAPGLSGRIEP